MSAELPGQLPLFTLDGIDEELQPAFDPEVCDGHDCWCVAVLEDDEDE